MTVKSQCWWFLVSLAGLGGVFLWSNWTSLGEVAARWSNDPQYAQGYFVPGFALAVLWARRGQCPPRPWHGTGWGLVLVAAAVAVRLLGTHFFYEWLELISLIPCLAGCCLCLGGRRLLRWALPALGLVVCMLPLPYRLEAALSLPLRRVATLGSAFCLQLLGFPAVVEDNVILISDVRVGVVEACNGLGMIATLFALVATATYFVRRPRWEKAVVLASTLPIAVFANVVRITLAGALYQWTGAATTDEFYHDLAGWVMMPVALALVWLEFKLLSHLLIQVAAERDLGFGIVGVYRAPAMPAREPAS
jgi:exosortase